MKSPAHIAHTLRKQWQRGSRRAELMLNTPQQTAAPSSLTPSLFPISIAIGLPRPSDVKNHPASVRQHIQHWRDIEQRGIGRVVWTRKTYQSTGAATDVPQSWLLPTMQHWAQATTIDNNKSVWNEWQHYDAIVRSDTLQRIAHTPLYAQWVDMLLRQRKLATERTVEEVVTACAVALELAPGYAQGAPLRAVSLCGIDSKFFERNDTLMQRLLDARFDGKASEQGLETFLNATLTGDHWLLLADLDGTLLPFQQLRVRSSELLHWQPQRLTECNINGAIQRVLITENTQCLHLLPSIPHTIAILGAGLDVHWMQAQWLSDTEIGYWGDIDSWGLLILANALQHQPHIRPLLMNRRTFDRYASQSVVEPSTAVPMTTDSSNTSFNSSHTSDDNHALHLLPAEQQQLLQHLLQQKRGRLEQEFIRQADVHHAIDTWMAASAHHHPN